MSTHIQRPQHWKTVTAPARSRILFGTDKLQGGDFFSSDEVLKQLLHRHYPVMLRQQQKRLSEFGAWVADSVDRQANHTDQHSPPTLQSHDRYGNLINEVLRNPEYLRCQRELQQRGFLSLNYGSQPAPFLLTFSLGYLLSQSDISLHMSATLAGTAALILARHAPDNLRRQWLPRLLRQDGNALTASIWTSERDPGYPLTKDSLRMQLHKKAMRIVGLKWFAGNPDCDLSLVTARGPDAPAEGNMAGLYLIPKVLANGKLNRYRIRRLKPTPGTRGLAVGEVELGGCHAVEVAPASRATTILQAASTYSRIHAAVAGTASQRRTLMEGIGATAENTPNGKRLTRQPAEQDLLLDLSIDYEADMSLAFAAAAAFDRSQRAPSEVAWLRLLSILANYRCTTDAVDAANLGMQLFGCNGYVDDFTISRLQRDALGLRVWGGVEIDLAAELTSLVCADPNLKARFGRHIREIIEQAPLKASRLSGGLRKALANYEELMRYLTRFPDAKARISRHLLPLMADISAAGTLLEDAGYDLGRGDARKAMVLDGFLRRHFADHNGLAGVRNAEQLRHFDALMSLAPVPVDSDWEKGLSRKL